MTAYGRSPLESILPDVRQVALAMERRREFGEIPAGVTVWRDVRSGPVRWHILPDPERPVMPIKPGGVIYIERLDRRRTYDHS